MNAKEVVLEMLRRVTIKGGLGKVFEYVGEGVKTQSGPERKVVLTTETKDASAAEFTDYLIDTIRSFKK